jgi:hypothetical protein
MQQGGFWDPDTQKYFLKSYRTQLGQFSIVRGEFVGFIED